MSNERGETQVTAATGLFRTDGGIRGLSYARTPQSRRRRSGIAINVRNGAGVWLRTQLSVEGRDFYGVFVEAVRQVATHGGLAFNETALRPRLKAAAEVFLGRHRLRAVRVSYHQVLEADEERDPQAEVSAPYRQLAKGWAGSTAG